MSSRKTFNDFLSKSNINKDDYVVGFDLPEVGGEKKFKLAHLRDFVNAVDVHTIETSGSLPVTPPHDPNSQITSMDAPFLNGKIFHAKGDSDISLTLPDITAMNTKVQLMVVNMTNHKRVEVSTVPGMNHLHARGVSNSLGQIASTFLKKKYDTAIFYYCDEIWYGYGDLDGASSLNIKTVSGNYAFTLEDEDKILHFNHNTTSSGASISLPNPTTMVGGTQFFVHNISDGWIEFQVPSGVNFHARAKFLRRKYDDAAVYTDGVDWFATGDLS